MRRLREKVHNLSGVTQLVNDWFMTKEPHCGGLLLHENDMGLEQENAFHFWSLIFSLIK